MLGASCWLDSTAAGKTGCAWACDRGSWYGTCGPENETGGRYLLRCGKTFIEFGFDDKENLRVPQEDIQIPLLIFSKVYPYHPTPSSFPPGGRHPPGMWRTPSRTRELVTVAAAGMCSSRLVQLKATFYRLDGARLGDDSHPPPPHIPHPTALQWSEQTERV